MPNLFPFSLEQLKRVLDTGALQGDLRANTTCGIVQGISGFPHLQDGKFAGAVPHVFIDDPISSYGISGYCQDLCAKRFAGSG